ncbi:MAG: FISUMP domain-containing protein [Prolixibacteraceae bacterium]
MKFALVFVVLFFLAFSKAYPQEPVVSFESSSDTIVIDSIRAINLSTNQNVFLYQNESLHLKDTLILDVPYFNKSTSSTVYPNPCLEQTTLKIQSERAQEISIRLSDLSGQTILQSSTQLFAGANSYAISCQNSGMYLATVQKSDGVESFKIIQTASGVNEIRSLNYQGDELSYGDQLFTDVQENAKSQRLDKSDESLSIMGYHAGDILLFHFYSGIYETVYTDSPDSSITITPEFFRCVDFDGTSYPVVQIGEQVWMAKNLATTHYNSGDSIPTDLVTADWNKLQTGAYAPYLSEPKYIPYYGLLYNWFAVNDERGVCPAGWHVSTDAEWVILLDGLGGSDNAGGQLKTTGTNFWLAPNDGATNSTGFSALPSSGRNIDGVLYNDGRDCYYWLADERDSYYAFNRHIYCWHTRVAKVFHTKVDGFAVRCLKDN